MSIDNATSQSAQTTRSLWFRAMLAVAAMLFLSNAWLWARLNAVQHGNDVVVARELQIVDEAGQVVIHLVANEAQRGVYLKDRELRNRIVLHHDDDETAIFIKDDRGDTRIGIAQFAHGGGGVALHGKNMKGAAVLYHKGNGTLTFYAPDGQVQQRYPDTSAANN